MFQELELAHPWWLLLLPVPLLVYWLAPAYQTIQPALKVPFFQTLAKALNQQPSKGAHQLHARGWQTSIRFIAWACIIVALAKPQVLGPPQVREEFGRDVMVVVDLSGSMAEPDFVGVDGKKITRLAAVKQVLADFAQHRDGDRLGLILFGDAAFVQTPFTADRSAWLTLLNQTDVAMAGQSTHLGDAIGLAIKVFDRESRLSQTDSAPKQKVAIVLTDGNDNGSFVEPLDAAKVAKIKGVRIHMIAMGNPQTVGEQALDMNTINQVAKQSGGQAFSALNRDELVAAYDAINQLEPKLYQSTNYRRKISLHHYLIMFVVALHLLAFALATFTKTRSPLEREAKQQGEQGV